MKKLVIIFIIIAIITFIIIIGLNIKKNSLNIQESSISKDMAYEGVNNYCHSAYDWNIAKDNPSIMYVEMGEETESDYQVIFCSYTGAFVYFYVNKSTGSTRLVEYVPNLNIESEAGTINLFDYLNKNSSANSTNKNIKYQFTSADNDAVKGNAKILKVYELTEKNMNFEYNGGFDFSKNTIDRNITGTAKENGKNKYDYEENVLEHQYKIVFEFNENKDTVKVSEYDNSDKINEIDLYI